jgi:uncharacterized damage-inducible protein DinB
MKEPCKNNLDELIDLLSQMSNDEYAKSCESLFGASIGQHTRHIIELYLELIYGVKNNEICYDRRIRNVTFETDVTAAIEAIDLIKVDIDSLQDAPVKLKADYGNSDTAIQLDTSFFRELAYNLEHSIHHQALIKVALKELGKLDLIDGAFGMAPSTTRFKKETSTNS